MTEQDLVGILQSIKQEADADSSSGDARLQKEARHSLAFATALLAIMGKEALEEEVKTENMIVDDPALKEQAGVGNQNQSNEGNA